MSQRQNRKKNLLERDDYRCGIHLGGCGKKITMEETSVDHIIPKNILRASKLKEIKHSYKSQNRQSLDESFFNLQPMCSDCNNVKKQGNFPPQNIVKKCSNKCCKFIYIYEKRICSLAFTYYFPKKSKTNIPSKSQCIFIVLLCKRYQFTKEKNELLLIPDSFIIQGTTKGNETIGFNFNQYGGNTSIIEMLKNNKKYTKEELIDSAVRYLSTYPKERVRPDVEKLINFEEAKNHYADLISKNQKDIEAYFNQGEIKYELGEYSEALIDYSKTIKLNPKHIKALHKQGDCYYNLGKFEEAKNVREQVKILESTN